ncbi:MAG TPA: 2OG-Fe(II) oxygenase, partial [Candidatus Acidoferrales bacterium]|nr:2OG-Fe(II) oxygenase [Candidatus Acidoferrales bacterium]
RIYDAKMPKLSERISEFPWPSITENLWQCGFSRIGTILNESECSGVRELYENDANFRARIDMARFRFGKGEYKYFRYPLPDLISGLRRELYARLHETANEWMTALRLPGEFPDTLEGFLQRCKEHGQVRPTPLLLQYRAGDFNCLHQDVYGEIVFPFQVIVALSDPATDFEGGELLLVEQLPRAQSRGHVLKLSRGEAAVITTRYRPVKGARGYYRSAIRHGVSTITKGERFTLGIVFHDSK